MAEDKETSRPNSKDYAPKINLGGKTRIIITGNKNVKCTTPGVVIEHRNPGGQPNA